MLQHFDTASIRPVNRNLTESGDWLGCYNVE